MVYNTAWQAFEYGRLGSTDQREKGKELTLTSDLLFCTEISSQINNYTLTELQQGRTRRWILAWSHQCARLPDVSSQRPLGHLKNQAYTIHSHSLGPRTPHFLACYHHLTRWSTLFHSPLQPLLALQILSKVFEKTNWSLKTASMISLSEQKVPLGRGGPEGSGSGGRHQPSKVLQ